MQQGPTLKSILGVPFVPSGKLTRRAIRIRRKILRAHRAMAPPPVRVLEGLFGLFDNRVLGLLVEFDIPDLLTEARTVDELAAMTKTDGTALDRVLQYAAGRGYLDEDGGHRYKANPVTEVLRRNHDNTWRGWVEFAASEWFWNAWAAMKESLHGGGTSGMETANGAPFFDYVTKVNSGAGESFNRAMEAGSTMQGLALAHALDWKGTTSVCDIGGGTGAALRYLLREHQHLRGALFDLPDVVSQAPGLDRLEIQSGDFFTKVPSGFDCYLLLAVIHDWNDEEAVTILANVARAMPRRGRAFVVENELPAKATGDFAEASDLLMLVLGSGRERTRAAFRSLFARAGLKLEKVHVLPTGFSAFEVTTTDHARGGSGPYRAAG